MRFSFRMGNYPIIPTPHLKVQRFFIYLSRMHACYMPVDRASTTHCCRTPTPHKDIHSTHTYIVYIIHTINNITTYTHTLTHSYATHKQSHTKRMRVIGTLAIVARLVCACARCLDFFSVARTLCLCSTISHNLTHYTYLAHTYIHTVGYTYTHMLSPHIRASTRLCIHTHTYTRMRVVYTHSHTDSVLLY